jgi:hypothetical protein
VSVNGTLSVAGAKVSSAAIPAGTPVEASINFGAAPSEQFGMATGLSTSSDNRWAVFTTLNTTNTLYASVNYYGTIQSVSLGALPSGYHDYRIQPVNGTFQFYVDGALKATISGDFSGASGLMAVFSSFDGTQPPMQVDWARWGAYRSSGTFVSSVLDTQESAPVWEQASWTSDLPAGTTVQVLTRTGNTAAPDSTWSAWSAVSSNGQINSPSARYLQYEVVLSSTGSALTPVLYDLGINWM